MVEVTEQTTGASTATGNSYDATVDGGNLAVRSSQALQGSVNADMRLDAAQNAGASVVLNTAASGNVADAGVYGGYLSSQDAQSTAATTIYGHSHVEAPDAKAGDLSASVQAIGNSQGYALRAGASDVSIDQANAATVTSDGGGVVGHVSGTATFSAATAANNITASSDEGADQRITANQSNAAALTQAAQFTAFGNAYVTTTAATATGNNLSAGATSGSLSVTANQDNQAYMRAQAESSGAQFGAGTASAYGVGNSLMAGVSGDEVNVDAMQLNGVGGVEAVAVYTGGDGYDAMASATAVGNAATGYACSDCGGTMRVANAQTNNGDAGATSTVRVTGSARSVTGAATAVGNTASYYVTRPSY